MTASCFTCVKLGFNSKYIKGVWKQSAEDNFCTSEKESIRGTRKLDNVHP